MGISNKRNLFIICLILLISSVAFLNVYASEADTYMERALSSTQKGDFGQAILNAREAGRLFEKQGNVRKQIQAFTYLSNAYQSLGHYNKSLKNLKTALDLAKKTGDGGQTAYILEKLGSTYIFMEKLEVAETYLNKSLSISYEENYPDVRISTLNKFADWLETFDGRVEGRNGYLTTNLKLFVIDSSLRRTICLLNRKT